MCFCIPCFCNPSFRDLEDSAARLRCGRCGVKETGLGLAEADSFINIAGDLCGEEGRGTSSLFSKMFNSERLHRVFGATLQILFLDDQSTHLDLRGREATPPIAMASYSTVF